MAHSFEPVSDSLPPDGFARQRNAMEKINGAKIHINGVVQGVGFRPFVYGLAKDLSLKGWVRNTSAGVDIEIDASPETLDAFLRALREDAPPLARIDEIHVEKADPNGFSSFEIIHSQPVEGAFQPISPDVSLCDDCARELSDPKDRRYRYPFTNCTNCGPRFTIICDIPYDRPNTTMAPFEMCPACSEEYNDPLDRRFHAQPVACPVCGPHLWLEVDGVTVAKREEALQVARNLLREGEVVAIKGLGGFHLACDATSAGAVRKLRERKLRVDKPFAVMMPDLEVIARHCRLDPPEGALLRSRERPIVILERDPDSNISPEVAPAQNTIGVMLPYTPLHLLLLQREEGSPEALVMTSGNLSEEPIATDNEEARVRLSNLADAFLMHDRDIRTRCDDAVVRSVEGRVYPLRRARGYAPFPVRLPWDLPPLLAAGGELKNTFCITRGKYAFLSHHIGDMENYETLRAFEDGVDHFEKLFRVHPELLVYDLHPNYMATRYVLDRAAREGLPAIGVQHHHAHIAACMAEHGLEGQSPVAGISFDGTGYGEDGEIWGGEVLLADYVSFTRSYHLDYVPMPGGDAAVRQPWRLALSWLRKLGLDWDPNLPPVRGASEEELSTIDRMLELDLNAPLTSSMGRLFDAVSALIGLRSRINYEAQAAIELEALVEDGDDGGYPFVVKGGVVDPSPMFQAILEDLRARKSKGWISGRFHRGVAEMVLEVSLRLRDRHGIRDVVLSGGVWQNMILLRMAIDLLREAGFKTYVHREVPTNDGGISLGQAVIAAHSVRASVAKTDGKLVTDTVKGDDTRR
jgi:hydrogenase maturation protein HypF